MIAVVIIYLTLFLNTFSIDLTLQEKNWINKNLNKEITINVYNPSHIYLYKNDIGDLSGVYTKLFDEISEQTNLKFSFKNLSREEIQNLVKNGEGDIVFDIARTSEREKYYSFLPTLNNYAVGFFTNTDKNIDSRDYDKLRIGYVESTSDYYLFKKFYPNFNNLLSVSDKESFGFWALDAGVVDILIGKSSSDILKDYKFIPLSNIPTSTLWMGINKQSPELKTIFEKFKIYFDNKKVAKALRKERPIFYGKLLENNLSMQILKNNYTELKVLIPQTDKVFPLFYRSNNQYKGYIMDRLEELSELTGLPIVYTQDKSGDYDIKAIETDIFKTQSKYFIPFYESQIAVFSNENANFIDSHYDLEEKNIGFTSFELINDFKNPIESNNYFFFKNNDEALKAIMDGKIDYFYGDFKIVSMAIGNSYLDSKIKVAGFLNKTAQIGFGIKNDPHLANIVDKLFPNHLPENRILKSELTIPKRLLPNYKSILTLSAISLTIIVILFYALRKALISTDKANRIAKALVESFEAANELNDLDTGNHILRVNLYSKFMAEKLSCKKSFIKDIGEYASLHDVGKIAIPDSILKKPGKLTPEEFDEMKKHVIHGYDLIKKMQLGTIAENIPLYHHEKWNGTGYCNGLKGEEIPLEARIVALADVYDALRQKRVYKDGFTHRQAMEIIESESGKHFDPKLVAIFLKYNNIFNQIFTNN